jgi:hypothetical protein
MMLQFASLSDNDRTLVPIASELYLMKFRIVIDTFKRKNVRTATAPT